jgi:hypothetical protein
MKRTLIILIITLLVIGCAGKTDEQKADAKINNSEFVEVYEEPRHQLVFENEDFKILDIRIKPEDTTLFHRHRNPMLYISLGWQKSAAQTLNADWSQPRPEGLTIGKVVLDTSYLTQPLVHRVSNVGTKKSRLIGILNTGKILNIRDKSKGYEVNNRWFRSKRINLNPGDTINFPKLEFPIVVVLVSGNEIKVIKDNKSRIHIKKWLQVEDMNQLINSGDNKIEIIQIEVLN